MSNDIKLDTAIVPSVDVTKQPTFTETGGITTVVMPAKATVVIVDSFNMPNPGNGFADVFVSGIEDFIPGQILWSRDVGFLEIKNYDKGNGRLTLINRFGDQAKIVGETIPANTMFALTSPGVSDQTSGVASTVVPYLDADLTIPANGGSTTVKVTNINGLAVGNQISIDGQIFDITAIVDAFTITVRNNGQAGPTGTVIEDDANTDGILDVPVIVSGGTNICDSPTRTNGLFLLGCTESGASHKTKAPGSDYVMVSDSNGLFGQRKVFFAVDPCMTIREPLIIDQNNPVGTIFWLDVDNIAALDETIAGNGVPGLPIVITSTAGDDVAFNIELVDQNASRIRISLQTALTKTPTLGVGQEFCVPPPEQALDIRLTAVEDQLASPVTCLPQISAVAGWSGRQTRAGTNGFAATKQYFDDLDPLSNLTFQNQENCQVRVLAELDLLVAQTIVNGPNINALHGFLLWENLDQNPGVPWAAVSETGELNSQISGQLVKPTFFQSQPPQFSETLGRFPYGNWKHVRVERSFTLASGSSITFYLRHQIAFDDRFGLTPAGDPRTWSSDPGNPSGATSYYYHVDWKGLIKAWRTGN